PLLHKYPTITLLITLSLHDALPIYNRLTREEAIAIIYRLMELTGHHVNLSDTDQQILGMYSDAHQISDWSHEAITALIKEGIVQDRKSTRLNSSHVKISYAVFCLKK